MTDNEIIKALECLSGNRAEHGDTECARCCFNSAYCVIDVAENTLELINRQKAEIDILIRKKESLRDEISDLKAEVERLNIEKKALLITVENMRKEIRRLQVVLVNFMDEIYEWGNKNNVDTNSFAQIAILGAERDKVVKEIKSEAIKEFAERLKNEIINDTAYGCDITQHSGYYDNTIKIGDIPEYIDNLVKEMTERKE